MRRRGRPGRPPLPGGLAAAIAATNPPGRRGCSARRAPSPTPAIADLPGFELHYEATHEALAAGLGDAFDPLFDAGRTDAESGRALTPEVWAAEQVAAGA